MLAIAITTFFILALIGAFFVIFMMFVGYGARIASVVRDGFNRNAPNTSATSAPYRLRLIKSRQLFAQHRTLRPTPIHAAA